jgi:hypothetical protein
MDDKRKAGFSRRADMRAESPLLRLARRIVIMIIEPGFADCHDFFTAAADHKFGQADVRFFVGVMRMRADRAINVGKALRYRKQRRLTANAR